MMVELEIKTTKAIHLLLEMNNYSEEDISKIKWVSVESLIKKLKCPEINEMETYDEAYEYLAYRVNNIIKELEKRC